MRGSPLLRAALALLILLALGFPLHRLLEAGEAPAVAAAVTKPEEKAVTTAKVQMQVDFTTAPSEFRLLSLGEEIWKESNPAAHLEHELTLPYPKEGIDLQVEIAWPENARAAARIHFTDPQGVAHERFVWGEGPATEVLTFP